MIELEAHENGPTPPFSVCKFLLEQAAVKVSKDDKWEHIAQHLADVRDTLPEHVRTACDAFIKHNRDDIISMLQFDNDLESQLASVANHAESQSKSVTAGSTQKASTPSPDDQQEIFRKFWEEKGKFCGACLTLTKKIQKWLSLNCTQTMIADRVVRMCQTMTGSLRDQCMQSGVWIKEFVLKNLFAKLPLPNHCAYIGLCEKTMVIRALANPVQMSKQQNSLIQAIEGVNPNLEQEGEMVFQEAHDTPTTDPEITFDLSSGGVSYRDVDKSTGAKLPKVYIDGTHSDDSFATLLETGSTQAFLGATNTVIDRSDPKNPMANINAQDDRKINVPLMHDTLTKANSGSNLDTNSFNLQGNHLPIENKYLKGCAACQFTIGALFEFMSNPRTIRTILPAVKNACSACNSPDEVQKCQDLETQGVAFYQDVIRQGMPSKWCPRLELCEIQYFYPSPFVLSDSYHAIEDQLKQVSDF